MSRLPHPIPAATAPAPPPLSVSLSREEVIADWLLSDVPDALEELAQCRAGTVSEERAVHWYAKVLPVVAMRAAASVPDRFLSACVCDTVGRTEWQQVAAMVAERWKPQDQQRLDEQEAEEAFERLDLYRQEEQEAQG